MYSLDTKLMFIKIRVEYDLQNTFSFFRSCKQTGITGMDNNISEKVRQAGFDLETQNDISSSQQHETIDKSSGLAGKTSEIQRIKYPKTAELMTGKINLSTSEAAKEDVNMKRHSAFLRKRLAKGHRYFDSGDYQMAKEKSTKEVECLPTLVEPPTGDEIPTPDTVPKRKISNSAF